MKLFSSKTAAGIAAALVFAAPFAAGALTIDDMQSQVRALLSQITQLQEKIRILQTTPTPTQSEDPNSSGNSGNSMRICGLLNRTLGVGSQGDDVSGLQEFLSERGFLNANVTGYFGPLTTSALARWQSSEGVDAAGVLGPISRDRLKTWCGGSGNSQQFSAQPTRGSAPMTVTFSTWLSGFRVNTISYTIDYGDGSSERAADCNAPADACISPGQNTHVYSTNGTYTATLNKITNTCPAGAQCFAAPMTEIVGKVQITVGSGPVACTLEYNPVCGAKQVVCIKAPCNPVPTTYGNKCAMTADGASFLYQGECKPVTTDPSSDPKCKAWYDGCNTCSRSSSGGPAMCTLMACMGGNQGTPYCKAYFDDTNTSGNKPPVISGFSGPTNLAVGQTGTWSVNASDPEGGSLSYSLTYGDENSYLLPFAGIASLARDFIQTSGFTHSYSNAGIYTVIVVVKDSTGQQAKSSATVNVGSSDPVVCTMEYSPVCGQPPEPACRHTQPFCAIATPGPTTYSNRCMMQAAGATFLYSGACTTGGGCLSGGATYSEGYTTSHITNPDGTNQVITDAYYICRSGQWQIQGNTSFGEDPAVGSFGDDERAFSTTALSCKAPNGVKYTDGQMAYFANWCSEQTSSQQCMAGFKVCRSGTWSVN